jgi:hypothetical protein
VTVREDLMNVSSPLGVNTDMKSYIGKSFFITSIECTFGGTSYYELEGVNEWTWDDNMLIPGILPKEYIVECNYRSQCEDVISYFYGERRELACTWKYIICEKELKYNIDRLEDKLRDKDVTGVPVFTYEQWEQIKQQTEKLNNMTTTNVEIKNIEIPSGYEFDKIENGTIKLKKLAKQILTHKDILDVEAEGKGYVLLYHGIHEVILSTSEGAFTTDCITRKDAERAKAFIALMRIANYYNKHYANNWEANWKATSQAKYYVVFNNNASCYELSCNSMNNESHIYFATNELARLALENNKEIFDTFFK